MQIILKKRIGMCSHGRQAKSGFTLAEIMVASGVLLFVVTGAIAIYISSSWIWNSTTVTVDASQEASKILAKIVYGVGTNMGIRAALASTVNVAPLGGSWMLGYKVPGGDSNLFVYYSSAQCIVYSDGRTNEVPVMIGTNVTAFSAINMTNGIALQVSVVKRDGRFVATNTMSTFVNYRN